MPVDNPTPGVTDPRERWPSLLDALIPAIALVSLLGLSYLFFGRASFAGSSQVALLFCAIITSRIG